MDVSALEAVPTLAGVARDLVAALTQRVGAVRYGLWFDRNVVFRIEGSGVTLAVPNAHFQSWLDRTFGEAIGAAVVEVCGPDASWRIVVASEFEGGASPETPVPETPKVPKPAPNLFDREIPLPPPPGATSEREPARSRRMPEDDRTAFGSRRTPSETKSARRYKALSDFVVGAGNRVAHASAVETVEAPGMNGNPLVYHGPVGTGKTHLLEGIYAGLRRTQLDGRPVFTTAEEFTTRFVQAARFGKQNAFRRQFRECAALLIDDLHFFAGKRATQEEFLHTFDSLVASGRQIVVTMDCHPHLADELMPELSDRLVGGAVWSLTPPDEETRYEILRVKSHGTAPTLSEETLRFLAKNLKGNARELEGAINSVRHYSRVTGKPADASLVREALGDLLRHAVRVVTVEEVDTAVRTVLGLTSGALQSNARAWAISRPRMIATYLARKHSSATYGEIAKHFGVKTHSTAVAAEKKVRNWMLDNAQLPLGDREWRAKDLVERIERELLR